jgi:hypothetical protein
MLDSLKLFVYIYIILFIVTIWYYLRFWIFNFVIIVAVTFFYQILSTKMYCLIIVTLVKLMFKLSILFHFNAKLLNDHLIVRDVEYFFLKTCKHSNRIKFETRSIYEFQNMLVKSFFSFLRF